MTDPSLTPQQEQAVRRALADARPTGPPPPEVVARLDAALAELTADRRPDEGVARTTTADVVPLGTRRRRWVGTALVAAAAVVAVGVGIGPLVDGWRGAGGDADLATTADDSGEHADSDGEGSAEGGEEPFDGDLREEQGGAAELAERPSSGPTGAESVPRVRPAHFDRDVALVRDGPFYLASEGDARSPDTFNEPQSSSAAPCGPDPNAAERAVPVRYQRQPATLLFRAPEDGTQVVELYLCSGVAPEPADGAGKPRDENRTGTGTGAERVTTLVVP